MHALTILGYLQKLKRGLGLFFDAYFLCTFSIKMFLIYYSIIWPSFQTYFLLKISNNILIIFLILAFGDVIKFKIYLSLSSLAMVKIRGKERETKFWIFWEWQNLFRWNKKHFSHFSRDHHLVKKRKIADTSLKYTCLLHNLVRICFFLFGNEKLLFVSFNSKNKTKQKKYQKAIV